jgi:hypothetical protein
VLQRENRISDAGAAGLGEGMKVNSSLQGLYLVRLFDYCLFFVGAMRRDCDFMFIFQWFGCHLFYLISFLRQICPFA